MPTQPAACPDRSCMCTVRILPLGSPWVVLKRSYVRVPVVPDRVVHDAATVRGVGGVPGVVQAGGYRGRGSTHLVPTLVLPGPNQCQDPLYAPRPGTPGPLGPPHTWAPHHWPVQPIWARFSHKYTKVSHESRVSTKYAHEACHTPCSKKGSKKSRP